MLRTCACFLLLAAPAPASELLTQLDWNLYPRELAEDRASFYLTVGNAPQWHVGHMTAEQSGEYFVADASTPGWGEMVKYLSGGSDVTVRSSGQSGNYEQTIPMPPLSGYQIDRLQYELYDFNFGRVRLSIYGTPAGAVPEPSAAILLLLGALFVLRRRTR